MAFKPHAIAPFSSMPFRRVAILLSAVSMAIALGCRGRTSTPVVNPPRVSIDSDTRRLVAHSSDPVRATYAITNRGGRDLILGEISSTCGCTSATVDRKVIPPGSSAVVSVEGRPPSFGEQLVSIQIGTNEPPPGLLKLRLVMVGSMPLPLLASPSVDVAFGVFLSGVIPPDASIILDIMENRQDAPAIDSVDCSLDFARAGGGLSEELPGPTSGIAIRRYRFQVSLTRPPGLGEFSGELTFRGPDARKLSSLKVPVHGFVREPVAAVPSPLIFQANSSGVAPPLRLSVIAAESSTPLVVECLEVDPCLSIRTVQQSDGRATFEVIMTKMPARSPLKPLVFRTSHPNAPTLSVPVQVWSKPRKDQSQ